MPEVDPDDDSVWRWVLHHYHLDPQRKQRRNVILAAYDNADEFDAALAAFAQRIKAEIDAGTRDQRERAGGVVWHPGHHAEQARRRLVGEAVRHGVDPRPLLDDGPLPPGAFVFGWDADGRPWSAGGGEPPPPNH